MLLASLLVPLCLVCAETSASPRLAPSVASVQLSRSILAGGNSLLVTVTLTAQAPLGGSSVVIAYSNESVLSTPPKGITIAAGSLAGSYTLATVPTPTATAVTVSGSLGSSSASAVVTVRPPQLLSATIPSTAQGGTRVDLSVTLDGPAPVGGSQLHLSFSPNIVALLPNNINLDVGDSGWPFDCSLNDMLTGGCVQNATATDSVNLLLVSAGANRKTIALAVPAVRDDRSVSGAVSLGTSSPLALAIRRPRPTNTSFVESCITTASAITSVAGPAALQFRVYTSDRVAKSGAYVNLSSRSASVVVPATLELDQGGTSLPRYACLPVALPAVSQLSTLSIVATAGGVTSTGSISDVPLSVSRIVVSPDSVSSGATVTATISMSAVVGSDVLVQLSSSNATAAPVLPSVTVVKGTASARTSFVARVPLTSVATKLTPVVSATFLSTTRSDTLIVVR